MCEVRISVDGLSEGQQAGGGHVVALDGESDGGRRSEYNDAIITNVTL